MTIKNYKVVFVYDGDEEVKYIGSNELEAQVTYLEEKLNLIRIGGDDCCKIYFITEEVFSV